MINNEIFSLFPFRTMDEVLNDTNIKVTADNLFIIIGEPDYPYPNDIIKRLEKSYLGYYIAKQLIAKNIKVILNYTIGYSKVDFNNENKDIKVYATTYMKRIELNMQADKFKSKFPKKEYDNGINVAMCTICHEGTHALLNIGGCIWAEAICKASEIIALTNDSLTDNEKKKIIKWAKSGYKGLKWKNHDKPIYFQCVFDLLTFADIIKMGISKNNIDRIKSELYQYFMLLYEMPFRNYDLQIENPNKESVIKQIYSIKKENDDINDNGIRIECLKLSIRSLYHILFEIYNFDYNCIEDNKFVRTIDVLNYISNSCKDKYKTKWSIA